MTDDFPVNGAVVDLVACSIAGGGRLELFLGQSGGECGGGGGGGGAFRGFGGFGG